MCFIRETEITKLRVVYREKVDYIRHILENLESSERFFSIDEFGPVAIKHQTGRRLVGPGEYPTTPKLYQFSDRRFSRFISFRFESAVALNEAITRFAQKFQSNEREEHASHGTRHSTDLRPFRLMGRGHCRRF